MWNDCLLEVQNPTEGQLIYMRDIYSDEVLTNYMVKDGKENLILI